VLAWLDTWRPLYTDTTLVPFLHCFLTLGVMSGVNIMTQYQSYFGTQALGGGTGLIFSLFYAGAFVAIASGPFLADRYGRKMPIKVGSIVALAGAIIQASSQSSTSDLKRNADK
jgi:MFS family permease